MTKTRSKPLKIETRSKPQIKPTQRIIKLTPGSYVKVGASNGEVSVLNDDFVVVGSMKKALKN